MPLIYPMISNEFDATAVVRFYGNSKSGTASYGWFPYSNYDSSQSHIISDPNSIFQLETIVSSGTDYYYRLQSDAANGYTIEAEIIDNALTTDNTFPEDGTNRWWSAQISWYPSQTISNNPDVNNHVITVLNENTPASVGSQDSLTILGDGFTGSNDSLVFQYRTDTNTTRGDIGGYVDVLFRLKGYRSYSPTS